MEDIELHIEQLVLHGFDGRNAAHIEAAVQQQIMELLQDKGLPPSFAKSTEIRVLNASGLLSLSPQTPATAIGSNIANLIFKGLAG
jgi:hypothetical protein